MKALGAALIIIVIMVGGVYGYSYSSTLGPYEISFADPGKMNMDLQLYKMQNSGKTNDGVPLITYTLMTGLSGNIDITRYEADNQIADLSKMLSDVLNEAVDAYDPHKPVHLEIDGYDGVIAWYWDYDYNYVTSLFAYQMDNRTIVNGAFVQAAEYSGTAPLESKPPNFSHYLHVKKTGSDIVPLEVSSIPIQTQDNNSTYSEKLESYLVNFTLPRRTTEDLYFEP